MKCRANFKYVFQQYSVEAYQRFFRLTIKSPLEELDELLLDEFEELLLEEFEELFELEFEEELPATRISNSFG
jgi:hypothetical protein